MLCIFLTNLLQQIPVYARLFEWDPAHLSCISKKQTGLHTRPMHIDQSGYNSDKCAYICIHCSVMHAPSIYLMFFLHRHMLQVYQKHNKSQSQVHTSKKYSWEENTTMRWKTMKYPLLTSFSMWYLVIHSRKKLVATLYEVCTSHIITIIVHFTEPTSMFSLEAIVKQLFFKSQKYSFSKLLKCFMPL